MKGLWLVAGALLLAGCGTVHVDAHPSPSATPVALHTVAAVDNLGLACSVAAPIIDLDVSPLLPSNGGGWTTQALDAITVAVTDSAAREKAAGAASYNRRITADVLAVATAAQVVVNQLVALQVPTDSSTQVFVSALDTLSGDCS